VAWPSAGYVPKAIVPSLFSLSSNRYPDADYARATVTVKVGSTSLPVVVHPPADGYGDDALTWSVTLPADFATSSAEVAFDITVSGRQAGERHGDPHRPLPLTAFVDDPADTAPDAPTAVTATAGDARATVSWTAPAGNGGAPITGYAVTPYQGDTPLPTRTFRLHRHRADHHRPGERQRPHVPRRGHQRGRHRTVVDRDRTG
jgi:hypothetical protein